MSGLETVFGKSSNSFVSADVLIILSIAWSMKTVVTLNLKAADVEKTHLREGCKIQKKKKYEFFHTSSRGGGQRSFFILFNWFFKKCLEWSNSSRNTKKIFSLF